MHTLYLTSIPLIRQRNKQTGFTMLELMVVVAILTIVAGSSIMLFKDTSSDAQYDATRFQMKQLADAVEAFYKDNSVTGFPIRDTPSNIEFLFDASAAGASVWNPDYRTGWRGPYLKGAPSFYVDIGDDLFIDGASISDNTIAGDPIAGMEINDVVSLADPYDHSAIGTYFQWRKVAADVTSNLDNFGRPYLVIDLDILADSTITPGVPRIISLGPNGRYEPNSCDYTDDTSCTHDVLCNSAGDDLVLCLR